MTRKPMKQRYYSNAAFEGGISIKLFPCQLPAIFVCLITMGFYAGCTSNEDLANPLAPENLRTAGSPVGLALTAGDSLDARIILLTLHAGIIQGALVDRFNLKAGGTS